MNDRVTRIQRIMQRGDALMQTLNHGRDRAWLGVELTMPQLKALLCVARYDGAPSGEIARNLGLGDITWFSQVGYGGGAGCGVVGNAAMAVAAGQCDVAVAWRSRKRGSATSRPSCDTGFR